MQDEVSAAVVEQARDRLIVALDFPAAEPAMALARRLAGRCGWVKVGMELFYAEGRELVTELEGMGLRVFLDLKLHDIPNTVAAAVRSVAGMGASLLTVHAAGGAAMLRAAYEAAMGPGAPALVAVTVLTSMDAGQMQATGVGGEVAEQVLRLARLAREAGIGGLVCSPLEAQMLRLELGAEPQLVVPGVRPAGAPASDQSRVATPGEAIRAGATRLVVGRPITRAADPVAAVEGIVAEMAAASAAVGVDAGSLFE